jgi:transposase
MRKRKPIEGDIENIARAMKESKNPSHFRRIQCVYLAMLYPEMTTEEIGAATLFTSRNVLYIYSDYRAEGLSGLEDGRGGRYRENLTIAQEEELLKPFEEQSRSGTLIVAGKVKKAYEEKIGREVAESTVYRMLDRHDFRKITPYRRHKKANKQEQETFKKTSVK